jgi:hypothetical protein
VLDSTGFWVRILARTPILFRLVEVFLDLQKIFLRDSSKNGRIEYLCNPGNDGLDGANATVGVKYFCIILLFMCRYMLPFKLLY